MGTYTSEIEGTLKCKSENRDPYILLRMVCAHMVRAPQYCNYVYLLVVILIQLLVGNHIEHRMTGQLILMQLLFGILTMKNKRMSIRRTRIIKIAKNSSFP